METRASYVLVGTFVLGLIAAAVFFVLWIGGTGAGDKVSYHVVLTGNVTGLAKGAAVRYRGIHKGEVGEIKLRAPTSYEVEQFKVQGEVIDVEIRVAKDTPIYSDTTASLEVQGLTGTPFIQLKRKLEPGATKIDPKDVVHNVIPGESSGLEKIFEEFPKAIASVTELAKRASDLLDENKPNNLLKTVDSANKAFDAVDRFASKGTDLVGKLEEPIKKLGALADQGKEAVKTLDGAADEFKKLMVQASTMLRENRRPIADFAATGLYEFSLFLTDMRKFVRTFDRLLTRVESDPSQFLFGNRQRGFETQGGAR